MLRRYTVEQKAEFIRDVIACCRDKKEQSVEKGNVTGFFDAIVGYETWEIHISAIDGTVRTTPRVKPKGSSKYFQYEQTRWGEGGTRWDSELREFLEREILKE